MGLAADLAILGGTLEVIDDRSEPADAVAVRDGAIVAVILDRNLRAPDSGPIGEPRVRQTLVEGREVYRA